MAKKFDKVTSLESLEAKLAEMREAQAIYSKFTQEQVDEICKQAAMAADKARIPLAKMANAETGMGVVEDKVIKNNYASEHIFNYFRHMKTCGVISEDKAFGTKRIAEPVGIRHLQDPDLPEDPQRHPALPPSHRQEVHHRGCPHHA